MFLPTAPRFRNTASLTTSWPRPSALGKNPDGSSNGQFLGTEAAKIIVLKPLSEILTPEEGRKRLRYLAALMQQAGITATGDLFYGGVNLQLENMLTKEVFGQKDSTARIVHVADGVTFTQLYGDQAIDEAESCATAATNAPYSTALNFMPMMLSFRWAWRLRYPGYINDSQFKGLFMFNSKTSS